MEKIKEQLLQLSEPEYQKFSSQLLPGVYNILGVRLPVLRKLARKLVKEDWRSYMAGAEDEYFEEVMLQGMVLGYVPFKEGQTVEELLQYIREFIPKINNWSVCDSFCSGLKFVKEYKEEVWIFLQQYFQSKKEYEVRFAVVMALNYYIEEEYLQRLFETFNKIKQEGYYAKMAVAWAVSMCFTAYPHETMKYLHCNQLDKETYLKALQKICESLNVEKETKQVIRKMKKLKE